MTEERKKRLRDLGKFGLHPEHYLFSLLTEIIDALPTDESPPFPSQPDAIERMVEKLIFHDPGIRAGWAMVPYNNDGTGPVLLDDESQGMQARRFVTDICRQAVKERDEFLIHRLYEYGCSPNMVAHIKEAGSTP